MLLKAMVLLTVGTMSYGAVSVEAVRGEKSVLRTLG